MSAQIVVFGGFLFVLGLCVGSFLNVVIWRLRVSGREVVYQGKTGKLSLSWPPSHCPVCDGTIQWYQNVPVLAWVLLRGKCAKCGTGIPIRYPMVELATGVMFLAFFLTYFVGHWQPDFEVVDSPGEMAMRLVPLLVHLALVSALLAASAIDADWYIIPLSIPIFLGVLGLVTSPLIAVPAGFMPFLDMHEHWGWSKPIVGAAVGLVVANVLVAMKVLPLSFAHVVEKKVEVVEEGGNTRKKKGKGEKRGQEEGGKKKVLEDQEEALVPLPKFTRMKPVLVGVAILLLVMVGAWFTLSAKMASLVGVCGGVVIFLMGVLPRDADQADVAEEVMEEISVPEARREVLKEVLFLMVPVAFAGVAAMLPWELPREVWMGRLLGSMGGLLVGGGVVWGVRIGGTLGFGKEAMGLGDVHLMAGVGAVVGAPLALLAFLVAPFFGLLWAGFRWILGKPHVLPFGPWLSVASILCLLIGKPLLEWYLGFFR